MSKLDQDTIRRLLGEIIDSHTGISLADSHALKKVSVSAAAVDIELELGYPAAGYIPQLREQISARLAAADTAVNINISSQVASYKPATSVAALTEVKNIIAVASGKGGVGKSATAVNIALALVAEGASVGVLDADIYGPSQPLMLGIDEDRRPEVREQKYFLPVEAYGLQTMSMGYLVTDKTPMVWRGPMVSGALTQMINQTQWRALDYLIVDMPPGTGDIQLTLSQQVPVTGAVIVTTPQDIALLDAKKGIEMFAKVNIPCLGIIENMAIHSCSNCGHTEHIFGAGGGERIAAEYGVPLLGSLPLDRQIRESLDTGEPLVAVAPEAPLSQQYREIARRLAAQLMRSAGGSASSGPKIIVSND